MDTIAQKEKAVNNLDVFSFAISFLFVTLTCFAKDLIIDAFCVQLSQLSDIRAVLHNLFLVCGTLSNLHRYLAAPLGGKIGQ